MIDIIIGLIVVSALVCAVVFIYKSKKNGSGCSCSGCPNSGQCRPNRCDKK